MYARVLGGGGLARKLWQPFGTEVVACPRRRHLRAGAPAKCIRAVCVYIYIYVYMIYG